MNIFINEIYFLYIYNIFFKKKSNYFILVIYITNAEGKIYGIKVS